MTTPFYEIVTYTVADAPKQMPHALPHRHCLRPFLASSTGLHLQERPTLTHASIWLRGAVMRKLVRQQMRSEAPLNSLASGPL